MTIRLTMTDDVSARLDQLGYRAGKVTDRALLATGYRYRRAIQRDYLSGQLLRKRTGATARKIKVYLKRYKLHTVGIVSPLAAIYEQPGGVTIGLAGGTVGALRFEANGQVVFTRKPIRLPYRPYMTESFNAFDFPRAFEESFDEEFTKEAKRIGLE